VSESEPSIYLDCHATTPCDPRVYLAMEPYFCKSFANPSSEIHSAGLLARRAVENSRSLLAKTISAEANEVVFTAGATESNAIVILGILRGVKESSRRRTILASPIEHKSVLKNCEALANEGYTFRHLPIDSKGVVLLDEARGMMTDDVLLVCCQYANNEVGTIQPVGEITQIAHDKGSLVLCDAVQALGRCPIDVRSLDTDFLTLSAHKAYGPKGIGALYVKGGADQIMLKPLFYGGGQEFGLRSGTQNVPAIVGFGEASRLALSELTSDCTRIAGLRDRFERLILHGIPSAIINGAVENRLCGNSSMQFPGADSEALMANAPELMISNGAACQSGSPEPSYVLTSMGLSREAAESTIRVGVGRFTTDEQIKNAAMILCRAYGSDL
jgi:cysteine desulfurase